MGTIELFFFYLFGAASPLSLAAINAAQVALTLFFIWRLFMRRRRPGLAEWLLIAFILCNVVSALAGPMPLLSLKGVLNFWSWSILFVAAALPVEIRQHTREFTLFLALSAGLTTVISACTFFLGTDFHRNRLWSRCPVGTIGAYGFFSQHLTYAGVIILVLAVVAGRAIYGQKKGRILWWMGAALYGCDIVMSMARTYYLAIIPTFIVLLWKKGRRWVVGAGLAALVLALLVLALGPRSLGRRVASTWNMNNASNAERVYLWISGWHMVEKRPILGWGPGIYQYTAGPYKAPYAHDIHYPTHVGFQTKCHAHNLYLMVAIQSGFTGLILFLAFVAAAFIELRRQPDPALRYGAMAALTAFLAGGFFEYNGGDAEVAVLLFMVVGLALGGAREEAPSDESGDGRLPS